MCRCLLFIYKKHTILCLCPVQQDLLDPLEDFFRIRLVITLLQTCGHYFTRGSSKRKLDSFLLLFQRYALSKGPLPLDVEFDVQVSPCSKHQELGRGCEFQALLVESKLHLDLMKSMSSILVNRYGF